MRVNKLFVSRIHDISHTTDHLIRLPKPSPFFFRVLQAIKNRRCEGLRMRLGDPGHPAVWLVLMSLSLQTSDHVRYTVPLSIN